MLWNSIFSAFIFFLQLSSFSVFALTCWQWRKSNVFAPYYNCHWYFNEFQKPYKAKYRKRKLKFATAQPFQKQIQMWTVHRSVAIMQRQVDRINSTETNSFLTITTEGCAGCAGRRSESSSSTPSESPSTSVTVRSIVACFAFIVSILHFEFKEAICSWYPLIFCASSWGNILFLMKKQPIQTGLAAFQLPWSFPS